MGTLLSSSKKFESFVFDESAEEEDTRWKSPSFKKKLKSKFNYSPVDNYTFLEAFAGGSVSKGKKARNETVIVDDADDTAKERIVRSDTALQSSSSDHTSKNLSKSSCHDPCTSYAQESKNASSSQKTATDRKEPDRSQKFRLTQSELVSIISDDDDDNLSRMSSNDFAEAAGSSGDPIPGQDKISSHEMGPSVVVYPEHVVYGGNCYQVAKLSFFCNFGRLYVSEKAGARDSLILEWKTADIISIESRWSDTSETANICIRIKSEQPKVVTSGQNSGILEIEFSVCEPDLVSTQDKIKSLDAQYMEKWDVDLDSYESFEGITYLEGECDSILISKRDFQLLQPEKFINDTIVDFYVEHLKKIKPADARVHFFNSFFFRKLADFDENRSQSIDAKGAFQRVRKWTKKLNIFQMDYIFIPVNFRLHWSLIVICHPGEVVNFADDELESSLKVPCILHLDSIKGSHRGLENCIRCYLWEEWKERNNDTAEDRFTKFESLLFLRVEAPQQQNSYDCALFMLHYMELFVKQAPIYFSPLNNFIDKNWFHPIEASLKRARIKRMIFELAKTNVQHGSSPGCNAKSSYELKDENDAEDAEEQPNSLKSASLALEEVEGCHPAAKVRQMKQLVHAMEVAFQNFKKSSQEDCEILKNKYDLECAERRRLHNELIELKGNIRVFCRCRPLNHDEIARGLTSVVDFDSSVENELEIIGADSSEKQFKFDHIFRPEDTQEAVFEQTSPLVVSVLDGFNVCIFAYGQTGTGKTFTMEGTAENRGVNYRTLEELFRVSKKKSDTMRYELSVSILEIYNEEIRDLLDNKAKQPANKLKVEELEVPGLTTEVRVLETSDVWKLLESASSARSVGSTNFSSRSHCLLRVTVVGNNLVNGQETKSRLWLVDLAGSERAGKMGAEGDRLKEAKNINKSLSQLRNVISALASKASHVPYRNSKLTHVLRGSLGGDSKTLMFVQISPSRADLRETISSLRFARDARFVERVPARKQTGRKQTSRVTICFKTRQKQKKKKKKQGLG